MQAPTERLTDMGDGYEYRRCMCPIWIYSKEGERVGVSAHGCDKGTLLYGTRRIASVVTWKQALVAQEEHQGAREES